MPRHSPAFTLIELSIVLVVIGLIAGIVVAGNELFRQSSLRKQISQLRNIETGVQNFRVKYGCYPGDCADPTIISGYTYSGNGNGVLEATWNDDENKGFWLHLTLSKMIEDQLVSHGVLASMNVPLMTLKPSVTGNTKGIINAYGSLTYAQNVLMLATNDNQAALRVVDIMNIDTKMDDGIAATGNVRSAGYYGSAVGVTIYAVPPVFPLSNQNGDGTTPCLTSGVYNTAATLSGCNMHYLLSNN